MDKIKNFKKGDLTRLDLETENSEEGTTSIFDSLPDRISWSCSKEDHVIKNREKIIGFPLRSDQHIAIIEAPFNPRLNQAYIVDAYGDTVMNVKDLMTDKYNSMAYNSMLLFFDVYYIDKELFFFLTVNNTDFRVGVDFADKSIGYLIESR